MVLPDISHLYKDACSLAQGKGLASLIYHEPVFEVRFMRGAAGTTRILTIRGNERPCVLGQTRPCSLLVSALSNAHASPQERRNQARDEASLAVEIACSKQHLALMVD